MSEQSINDIEVSNLNEYIKVVTEIRMQYLYGVDRRNEEISKEEYAETVKESVTHKLYFRGQANKEWPIVPNVFRDNGLSCEATMTQKAYLCNPEILLQYKTPFERLTLLQHYELGTRLLDITANPLVALFFACQYCEVNEEINTWGELIAELNESGFTEEQISVLLEKFSANKTIATVKKDGLVYFKCTFAENFNKMEIQLLSYLAELDISKQFSARDLIENASHKNIITPKEVEQLSAKNYAELIEILQSGYFVEPNFSNQRLVKQAGSFLICGNINVRVKQAGSDKTLLIEKASGNLNAYFEQERIVIPEQYKMTILKELDDYNINEHSLFPEIDHQFHYIQMKCRETSRSVAVFSKYQKDDVITATQRNSVQPNNMAEDKNSVDLDSVLNDYFNLVKDLLTVDWEKSDSIKAAIYRKLKRHLKGKKVFRKEEIHQKCEDFYRILYKKYAGKIITS